VELDEALLDDFAQMAPLAGIDNDFPRPRHARQCNSFAARFPPCTPVYPVVYAFRQHLIRVSLRHQKSGGVESLDDCK
jgi:hypothetical protein